MISFRGLSLLFSSFFLCCCDAAPNQWDAFIYIEREGNKGEIPLRGFKTAEQCQRAAKTFIANLSDLESASYECGYKCKTDDKMHIYVCKDTRD